MANQDDESKQQLTLGLLNPSVSIFPSCSFVATFNTNISFNLSFPYPTHHKTILSIRPISTNSRLLQSTRHRSLANALLHHLPVDPTNHAILSMFCVPAQNVVAEVQNVERSSQSHAQNDSEVLLGEVAGESDLETTEDNPGLEDGGDLTEDSEGEDELIDENILVQQYPQLYLPPSLPESGKNPNNEETLDRDINQSLNTITTPLPIRPRRRNVPRPRRKSDPFNCMFIPNKNSHNNPVFTREDPPVGTAPPPTCIPTIPTRSSTPEMVIGTIESWPSARADAAAAEYGDSLERGIASGAFEDISSEALKAFDFLLGSGRTSCPDDRFRDPRFRQRIEKVVRTIMECQVESFWGGKARKVKDRAEEYDRISRGGPRSRTFVGI
ncbi:hypothetical protein NLI96_g7830 [Meripilus lineatus]|uniref:Uncharacterized protein n=1 Tax=Meripilus lineatus TaxID=2056292 RepID=A0AAD5UYM6_9APHY|nr:hypothetical protein NLI96_g7830 [Physisporinus lineatus]